MSNTCILAQRAVIGILFLSLTNLINAQVIKVTKNDSLVKDVSANMKADPGDSLRYTTIITVSGATATNVVMDAMGFDTN